MFYWASAIHRFSLLLMLSWATKVVALLATPLNLPSLLLCPVTLVLGVMAATGAIPKTPIVVVVSGHACAWRAGCNSILFETPVVVVVYGLACARGGGKMLLLVTKKFTCRAGDEVIVVLATKEIACCVGNEEMIVVLAT